MLRELHIRGLGVIEESVIELSPGLTALTGETGAGKTMVVSGLGLLLGQRAETDLVRIGETKALVEGRFVDLDQVVDQLDQVGGELDDGELIATRQIAAGRSRASLGGVQVPVATLAEVTGSLATIHGQSEQIRLGTPARQREVLDRSGGPDLAAALDHYRAIYAERAALIAERDELGANTEERLREIDLLRFGLDEIARVAPQPQEDADLAREAARLQAVDDLRMLAERASVALSGDDNDFAGAASLLGEARKDVERIVELDSDAAELLAALREASSAADDAAARVAGYLADLEADPLRLEAVTARRAELAGLARKYGGDVEAVLAWAERSAERLARLDVGDARRVELDSLIAEATSRLQRAGETLSRLRGEAADRLAASAADELAALAMPDARLVFELRPLAEPGPHGLEQVTLLFSANRGAAPGPLSKVASGGELSRVRLALEVVLADDHGGTFVFDEVDAGVGGRVATEVGRRLARLAQHAQVIVVTHLPQVAAFADHHLVVTKSHDGNVTASGVAVVTGRDREAEIARMMGADESDVALEHARELLRERSGA